MPWTWLLWWYQCLGTVAFEYNHNIPVNCHPVSVINSHSVSIKTKYCIFPNIIYYILLASQSVGRFVETSLYVSHIANWDKILVLTAWKKEWQDFGHFLTWPPLSIKETSHHTGSPTLSIRYTSAWSWHSCLHSFITSNIARKLSNVQFTPWKSMKKKEKERKYIIGKILQ